MADRICSAKGCERRDIMAREMCSLHYQRIRAGIPLDRPVRPESAEERFLSRVDKGAGCWLWTGSTQPKGYGTFERGQLAHRWAYENWVGQIPDGFQIDHLCRVKSCVNPQHLEPVTPAENVRRAIPFWGWVNPDTCTNGHPYTEANTYTSPTGSRQCRECRSARDKDVVRARRIARGEPPEGRVSDECRNGHTGQRGPSGKCMECAREATRRYRTKLKEKQ